MKKVNLIASGYGWECPECGELNCEMEVKEKVTCVRCSVISEAELPEHAYG